MFIQVSNLNKIMEMESFEKNNLKNIENTETIQLSKTGEQWFEWSLFTKCCENRWDKTNLFGCLTYWVAVAVPVVLC